ncbi:MAG: amidohydrolase family protein [Micrococcales bacterium]|nr:amidohydrolase family protein [Micrococcales bacterium]
MTAAGADRIPPGTRFAIEADRLLDARTGSWSDRSVVLVDGPFIKGVTNQAPDGWPLLKLPGTSLLPGLIDAHTHVLLRDTLSQLDLARQMVEENLGHRVACAIQAMSLALRHGFTTMRDLGTEGAGYLDVGLRDAVSEGIIAGPRLLVAGPAIRSKGRYPLDNQPHSIFYPVGTDSCTGADACREVVRTQVAYGIDWLKIYASGKVNPPTSDQAYPDGPLVWTEAEIKALVDEAHRQGIKVAAHAQTLSGTELAVRAGVDSIEHGFAISPQLAAEMADRGTALAATLLASREAAERGWYVNKPVEAAHYRSFANAVKAKVQIVLGTDVGGFEWTEVNQAEEMALMVQLGLSSSQALQAGTIAAAELLGLGGQVGAIEPGYAADLVAMVGDPLVDISAMQRVQLVIQGGRITVDSTVQDKPGS